MITRITGSAIFNGKAAATLVAAASGKSYNSKHILFARALTTEVAYYIIRNPVIGIVTESCSFATHGANMLRYWFKSNPSIPWVTGVPLYLISKTIGKKIIIENEFIEFHSDDKYSYDLSDKSRCENNKIVLKPAKKKSIVEYNLLNDDYRICYWPHRTYDKLTFSVMKEGLKNNFENINLNCNDIFLDSIGRIWFKDAPFIDDLGKIACEISKASPFLENQIEVYEEILKKLQTANCLKDIYEMLNIYFSMFILFHDTYEDVLSQAYERIKRELSDSQAIMIMNSLMWCEIDKWMVDSNIVFIKRKSLLSNDPIIPLPNLTIRDDLEKSGNRLLAIAESAGLKNIKQEILYYSRFFVAKEWKFFVNKLLFTRFSEFIKRLSISDSILKTSTIGEVLKVEDSLNETHCCKN